VKKSVPNDKEGGVDGSLGGLDGVSLLANGVTLGEGGKEDVAEGAR
jgi:hypothetical protein